MLNSGESVAREFFPRRFVFRVGLILVAPSRGEVVRLVTLERFELRELFGRERVGEPEGHKIGRTLLTPVGKAAMV